MLRLILVSVLVTVSLGARSLPFPDGRIVGGRPATIDEFPHQVSLMIFGSHACGGSIIGANKVLTAAHCTDGRSDDDLQIRYGSSYRTTGGNIILVDKICQHPKYDPFKIDFDVSVLTLVLSIETSALSKPIALHAANAVVARDAVATVSGWGRLTEGGTIANQLQAVEVPKVDDDVCNALYEGAITGNMVCFGYPNEGGKDACQGDSGGPLILGDEQVGVVSWGYGCARPSLPGIYARVAALREHIDSC